MSIEARGHSGGFALGWHSRVINALSFWSIPSGIGMDWPGIGKDSGIIFSPNLS